MQRFADARQVDASAMNTYGADPYRARKYDSAVRYLKKAIEARNGKGSVNDSIFLAMALHHAKQPGAPQALETARTLAKDLQLAWDQRVELERLIQEAEFELSVPPL
jgi:hypothetical protein